MTSLSQSLSVLREFNEIFHATIGERFKMKWKQREKNGKFHCFCLGDDIEHNKNEWNCCHQQVRAETISTMRVIGKFIGFVASRSYSYDGYRNSLVDQKQISIRNLVSKILIEFFLVEIIFLMRFKSRLGSKNFMNSWKLLTS